MGWSLCQDSEIGALYQYCCHSNYVAGEKVACTAIILGIAEIRAWVVNALRR